MVSLAVSSTPMSDDLTDFLLARLAEDEERARPKTVGMSGGAPGPMLPNCFECYGANRWALDDLARQHAGDDHWYQSSPEAQALVHAHEWTHADARQMRDRAEVEAKRRIVALHESWPVLIQTEPKLEVSPETWMAKMTSEIAWLTNAEYVKRFGTDPPTAPMLAAMVQVYADHPDFDPAWRV